MAVRGVQRATFDLDFLLMLSDVEPTHELLLSEGYQRVFPLQKRLPLPETRRGLVSCGCWNARIDLSWHPAACSPCFESRISWASKTKLQ